MRMAYDTAMTSAEIDKQDASGQRARRTTIAANRVIAGDRAPMVAPLDAYTAGHENCDCLFKNNISMTGQLALKICSFLL